MYDEADHKLEGKRGLVLGIANRDSIAYGCAKAFRFLGAEVAVTYASEKAKPHVAPAAEELESEIFMPRDVTVEGQMEKASGAPPGSHPGTLPDHQALVAQRLEDLRAGMEKGGLREAAIRALVYIRMPTQLVDERGFAMLRRIHETEGRDLTLEQFKALVREQFFMVLIDERRAVETLSTLIAGHEAVATRLLDRIRKVVTASATMTEESTQRMEEIAAIFSKARASSPTRRREAASS